MKRKQPYTDTNTSDTCAWANLFPTELPRSTATGSWPVVLFSYFRAFFAIALASALETFIYYIANIFLVSLFGRYYSPQKFQWLSVKLNFTTVLNQKCQPENYTNWSPNDEVLVLRRCYSREIFLQLASQRRCETSCGLNCTYNTPSSQLVSQRKMRCELQEK